MKNQNRLRPERTLFYDVDTQRDFMLPGGALYVPGAETILPALQRVTGLARRLGIRRICSMCRHFPGDRELLRNGGRWPDHCLDGTPGQRKVDETQVVDPCYLPAREIGSVELETALKHRGELIIEKQDVNVLAGNANARPLLTRLAREYDNIVIYGVTTDVCVDYAVKAFLEQGRIPDVVFDAIRAINPGNAAAALERWCEAGVTTITCTELEDLLGS
jgi:nicotinamidase/pyrazinamidase